MWKFEERVPKGPVPRHTWARCLQILGKITCPPPDQILDPLVQVQETIQIWWYILVYPARYVVHATFLLNFHFLAKYIFFYEAYESVYLNEYRNRVKCVHADSDMGQWGYFLLKNKFWREVLTLSTTFISANLYYEFVHSTWHSALSLQNFLKNKFCPKARFCFMYGNATFIRLNF